ncbi:glycosyltransferase family 2 protein [Deinococcus sp. JMULE3]|uniref:glycosyltransferase family 2 protein n=1 Tax=Deinococcus sp. JMULE3 TaxID=2518341 RepID=UPI00157715CA|nr:glycosyltransferase family 2 protein [Deinococcus sp. JMULE3]NTY00547.1 glycosyltransferase [Deinococcus sp. JMULE3]
MNLTVVEFLFLVYFALMNVGYAIGLTTTVRQLALSMRRHQTLRFDALLLGQTHKPISLLVPAYNEEATIEASVQSFLNLRYPQFEVIVVNDGSRDGTLDVLSRTFDLHPAHMVVPLTIPTKPVRGTYRSAREDRLIVIDKENGGKADSLNVAMQYARYPLFCALDADSLLDEEALLRVARRFADDDSLLVVGGTVRPLNGAVFKGGRIVDLHLPRTAVERFQIVEYIRAFLVGRTTLSAFGLLLIISGAFGLFRRDVALQVGGYAHDTVGEDMELIVRLHRHAREQRRPYAITYVIDPICWTQVPDTWNLLRRQRDRWQRGLIEALWKHRRMFLNPRYGRIGLVSMPYYVFFEALAPVIELTGYALAIGLVVTGKFSAPFVALFFLLAIAYGTLISFSAQSVEVFLRQRISRPGDRLLLLGFALLDNLGFRQWTLLIRFWATLTGPLRAGQWGKMERRRIDTGTPPTPPPDAGEPPRNPDPT